MIYTCNKRTTGSREHAKKLTITVDEEVYDGLKEVIGPRKISRFIEELVRSHVMKPKLDIEYKKMAEDEAREKEAHE